MALPCAVGASDVTRTRHNLSASGPGELKAGSVTDVCVFCHTPHNAQPSRALWNQALPGTAYTLYASATLKATLQQPTGSSRLCLSCHDGTVALGSVRAGLEHEPVAIGALSGRRVLGTDLSDDHPISFVYDSALAAARGDVVDPSQVSALPLDAHRQMQCTTCHDPHDATYRKFLRVDDRYGALCMTCHRKRGWEGSTHATSTATWSGVGEDPWPTTDYTTVAENACENCHRPHGAAGATMLLASDQVCRACHNPHGPAASSVGAEVQKTSAHPVERATRPREAGAWRPGFDRQVACTDCHHPHQMPSTERQGGTSGWIKGLGGVEISGGAVTEAREAYEVCFRCHGVQDQRTPGMIRQDNTRNVRLEFDPGNASYHPVAALGKYPTLPGLQPGSTASGLLTCTDCHDTDDATGPGRGPRGPHGSRFAPILKQEYQQGDVAMESPQSYALCYSCHARSALLSTGRFPHRSHLQGRAPASCAVCHDAHGSRQQSGLLNFMLRDRAGTAVVGATSQGRLEFRAVGDGHGECSLLCHGVEHDQRRY